VPARIIRRVGVMTRFDASGGIWFPTNPAFPATPSSTRPQTHAHPIAASGLE
jgi:hypothetical protein